MARKRTRKRATTRRRRTSAKRRSPVTSLRRHSVYLTNPKRRRRSRPAVRHHRRRRVHRNPPLVGTVIQGMKDAGATLVGGALARTASGLIPLPNTGYAGIAVGIGVALGVGMAARKVVGADTARFVTAGAMQVPLKALITTLVPQAGAFLGDYDNIGTYGEALQPGQGMGNYLNDGSLSGEEVEIGSYEFSQ